ncbi:DJ-1/PfpI family protein [Brevibacterium casei]|uniref:DJ-1/PfpI family protein n=1 Tax=Brevibacterium TaxID=1696 RepID=UPI00315BFBC9
MVGTDERYLPIKGDMWFSTGNHPIETLVPLLHLEAAGYDIDVATLSGRMVKFEHWAFPSEDEAVEGIYERFESKFANPLTLSEISDRDLDEYTAIYFPGGHGAMIGLPQSPEVARVLRWIQDRDRTLIAICHGPAALAAGGLGGQENPFAGFETAAYPDEVDSEPSITSGYLPGEMTWYVGEALQAQGITVINHDVSGLVHRDRNFVSGDSPQAANALGRLAVEYLSERRSAADPHES